MNGFAMKTSFDKESKGNSEMTYLPLPQHFLRVQSQKVVISHLQLDTKVIAGIYCLRQAKNQSESKIVL